MATITLTIINNKTWWYIVNHLYSYLSIVSKCHAANISWSDPTVRQSNAPDLAARERCHEKGHRSWRNPEVTEVAVNWCSKRAQMTTIDKEYDSVICDWQMNLVPTRWWNDRSEAMTLSQVLHHSFRLLNRAFAGKPLWKWSLKRMFSLAATFGRCSFSKGGSIAAATSNMMIHGVTKLSVLCTSLARTFIEEDAETSADEGFQRTSRPHLLGKGPGLIVNRILWHSAQGLHAHGYITFAYSSKMKKKIWKCHVNLLAFRHSATLILPLSLATCTLMTFLIGICHVWHLFKANWAAGRVVTVECPMRR